MDAKQEKAFYELLIKTNLKIIKIEALKGGEMKLPDKYELFKSLNCEEIGELLGSVSSASVITDELSYLYQTKSTIINILKRENLTEEANKHINNYSKMLKEGCKNIDSDPDAMKKVVTNIMKYVLENNEKSLQI